MTEHTPEEPSPRIATPVCVPFAPPEPAVLINIVSIAPSTAADDTVESVDTCIKSVDKKFVCSEAVNVYMYFHL